MNLKVIWHSLNFSECNCNSGITGTVSIDENGDRSVDYSILDMNPNTGNFEVVANYYGVSKQVIDVPGKRIHWSGGRLNPPPDVPLCGFDGLKCIENGKRLKHR